MGFANANILSTKDLISAPLFMDVVDLRIGVKEQRWVCTEIKDQMVIKCDDLGVNELEGPKEELQIDIRSKKYIHQYGLRHGILKQECRRMKRKILNLLVSDKEVCFRGQLVSVNPNDKPILVEWLFDEVMTRNKRLCEFNGCD